MHGHVLAVRTRMHMDAMQCKMQRLPLLGSVHQFTTPVRTLYTKYELLGRDGLALRRLVPCPCKPSPGGTNFLSYLPRYYCRD